MAISKKKNGGHMRPLKLRNQRVLRFQLLEVSLGPKTGKRGGISIKKKKKVGPYEANKFLGGGRRGEFEGKAAVNFGGERNKRIKEGSQRTK